ncbi:MAG: helix-turn-helix domain-containing protein [Candidatus Paceibacterota bacterium]
MNTEKKLQDLGLSNKEAKVYLALLELNQAPASDIARKAQLNRATTYVILDSLIEKALVSTYDQEKTTQYVASEPETLKSLVKERQIEWKEKEKTAEDLIPSLESIHNVGDEKPTIRFFDGEKGLEQSAEEFYKNFYKGKETVKIFYSRDRIENNISKELLDHLKNSRLRKKVRSETIYNYSKGKYDDDTGDRIKVNDDKFPISIDLEIYSDRVLISTLKEKLSAILIKDTDIADSFKTLFRLAQIGAKVEEEKENKN